MRQRPPPTAPRRAATTAVPAVFMMWRKQQAPPGIPVRPGVPEHLWEGGEESGVDQETPARLLGEEQRLPRHPGPHPAVAERLEVVLKAGGVRISAQDRPVQIGHDTGIVKASGRFGVQSASAQCNPNSRWPTGSDS